MTCIAAIVKDGMVYMGADSAGTDNCFGQVRRKDSKLFERKGFLIGCTSSYRMTQLLRFKLDPPKFHQEDKDLYEYMCTDFIDEVRKCLREGGFAQNNKGEEWGGSFLVGINGRIFHVEDDFQVGESFDNYDTCGCGDRYALGAFSALAAFETTNQKEITPHDKLVIALQAASRFNAAVRGPFIFENTHSNNEPIKPTSTLRPKVTTLTRKKK